MDARIARALLARRSRRGDRSRARGRDASPV